MFNISENPRVTLLRTLQQAFAAVRLVPRPESKFMEEKISKFFTVSESLIQCMASQRGQYYETQYFHGQNLIIAWVKSFVHGQNHFSIGKFFLSMGEFICAWAKSC